MIKLKIVLLGDVAVGKTSYTTRLINNKFFNYSDSTIGAAFSTKIMDIDNNKIKLEFWDTAGQERYKSLVPMYYKNSDAALIFYDINRIDTLDGAIKFINILKSRGPINIKYILIGNKYDMLNNDSITIDIVKKKLDETNNSGVIHIFTSSKTDYNIEYSITKLVSLINIMQKKQNEPSTIKLNKHSKYNFCCN